MKKLIRIGSLFGIGLIWTIGAQASDLETLILKGKYQNQYCEYHGKLELKDFPIYDLFAKSSDSDGRDVYSKVELPSYVVALKDGSFELNIQFKYRVLGTFCSTREVVVKLD